MLPNRILYYANIVKGERNDKAEKPCFYSFGTAEPHPILCKYSERRVQRQSGKTVFLQLWHCRAASYIMQRCCKRVEWKLLSYSRVQLHLMQMYEKKLTIKQNPSQFYPEPVIWLHLYFVPVSDILAAGFIGDIAGYIKKKRKTRCRQRCGRWMKSL